MTMRSKIRSSIIRLGLTATMLGITIAILATPAGAGSFARPYYGYPHWPPCWWTKKGCPTGNVSQPNIQTCKQNGEGCLRAK